MSNDTDPLAEIQSRLDNPPKAWCPRGVPEGMDAERCISTPSVAGVVESIDDQEDDYGGHRLITVRSADGSRVSIRGFGTILGTFFAKLEIDDAIGIEYEGEATPKTAGYSNYPLYRTERIAAHREPETVPEPVALLAAAPDPQDDPSAWPEFEAAP